MPAYVKCNYIEASQKGGMTFERELGKPFVFDPYYAFEDDDVLARHYRWLTEVDPAAFTFVTKEEYQEHEDQRAAALAEVHYCGDTGGVTKAGKFCERRVEEGHRCEHHPFEDVPAEQEDIQPAVEVVE